jgi:hypothetical protein
MSSAVAKRVVPDETFPGRPLAFYRPSELLREQPRVARSRVRVPFRRLLLALEPAQFFHHSRRLAAAIAGSADMSVDLLCLVDGFHEIFAAKNPAVLADPDAYLERISAVVATLARLTRSAGVSCDAHVVVGQPVLELARQIERSGADLLLLGGPIPGAVERLQALSWRELPLVRPPGSTPT